jgi:hypothetical protein
MALARQSALRAEYDQEYLEELTTFYRTWRKTSSQTGSMLMPPSPQRKPVPRLGEVMIDMGLLTSEQVAEILQERQKTYNALFE